MTSNFSPTHLRMLKVLSDCQPHTVTELHTCLWDELSKAGTVRYHLSTMKSLLRSPGWDVVNVFNLGSYQLVKLSNEAFVLDNVQRR